MPHGELTILQSKVHLIDPHLLIDDKDLLNIRSAIFDALIQRGKGGKYRPALAKDWRVRGDGRTWTFTLRSKVSFHNGEMLSGEDVVASLHRVCDPSIGGVMGTQGVFHSYLGDAEVRTIGKSRVRIQTPKPMADLLDLLVDIPIVPRNALDGLARNPIGTGPYDLQERQDGLLVMQAFAQHWRGRPTIKKLHWRKAGDNDEKPTALLVGEADVVTDLGLGSKSTLQNAEKVRLVSRDSSMCIIFMCNFLSALCRDKRVRQAMNYALNVPEIIERVKGGAAIPLNGPLTPLHLGHDPATAAYRYAPDKANNLLADAGYRSGVRLVLDVPTIAPDEGPVLASLMSEQYAKVGISTEIRQFDNRAQYAEMVRAKRIDDACCFDSTPSSTYRVLREKLHSGMRGPWWQGYSNENVNNLIDRAQATTDVTKRRRLYREAYRIIHDDAPWVFLYSLKEFWGMGSRARDWTIGIDGLIKPAIRDS